MIFYPAGLYAGERLALCSDEARLHFPYIAGLVNGFGRFRLSVPQILESAYRTFRTKPTKDQVAAWLKEYRSNYLLYIYETATGEIWGQLRGVPENALPRYMTAADKRSPAPAAEDLAAFDAEYARKKRERAEASCEFVNLSEHFGNLPKAAEGCETLQNVSAGEDVVVVVDVGEEEILSSPSAPDQADSSSVKPAKDEEAKTFVRNVFAYFLEATGRSEKQYELTDKRLQAGVRMYRVCLQRCSNDPVKAQLAMAAAVDGLISNKWHMGVNPNGKRYTEWIDHVYKDVETMEKRWQDGGFDPNV